MYWRLLILKQKIESYFFKIILKNKGVIFSSTPKFQGYRPRFDVSGEVILGVNCRFRALNSLITINATNKNAKVIIGDNCFFNHGVNISASNSITIGKDTRIGDNVIIFDTDFHCVDEQQASPKVLPVIIGRNVWVGANSIILAGSNIGDHSVIGAGTVVTGVIPPKMVYAGNPARKIKDIVCDEHWIRQ
jgi:acetyltransferase-like isoleucine patch superfamily enzyme